MYPLQRPFLKPRGFCPNPVVTFGVPVYADSIANKKCIGTPAWKEYWEEQLYNCINGYYTSGVFIPGRYYYYLNFCKTSSVKGGGSFYPQYVDFQYEFFLLIEQAKLDGKNIIGPKGRRKGVTISEVAIVDHGWRFLQGYHAGIGAGTSDYTDEFVNKWKYVDARIVPEFKTRTLSKNYSDIIAGWEEKDDLGGWTRYGTENMLYNRTMFSDPEAFKGKYFNDVIFEESGEFDHLVKAYQASKECVMSGSTQYGTIYFLGTGGNIKTGSSGFEKVWHDYKDFNCYRYFISGTKFYMPCVAGATNGKGEIIEDIPNLQKYTPEERIGMEDEERALEVIVAKKKELQANRDKTMYWEYCKDNPTDIKEVFRRAASNNFSIEILNTQMYEIKSLERRWDKYKLEFKKDKKGNRIIPLEVEAIPIPNDTPDEECIMILHGGHPVADISNLDVGGIDSYDQDQSMTTNSLGAMVVLRRQHSLPDIQKRLPVALIRTRPERKEKFYEMCLKASIYWKLFNCTLVDAAKPQIVKFYKDNNAEMYLAPRPVKYESQWSQLTNEYGVSINENSKPQMLGLLQTFFFDHGHKVWFDIIIDEALGYDDKTKAAESDKDAVDALGIALMQDGAMDYGVRDEKDMEALKPYDLPEWYEDADGNLRMSNGSEFISVADNENDRRMERAQHRRENGMG